MGRISPAQVVGIGIAATLMSILCSPGVACDSCVEEVLGERKPWVCGIGHPRCLLRGLEPYTKKESNRYWRGIFSA